MRRVAATGGMLVVLMVTPPATVAIPMPLSPFGVGVNPNTNRIYVTTSDVTVIDGRRDKVVATIPGYDSGWVGVNPTTNQIYVAKYNEPFVTVIDGARDAVIATIQVGVRPRGVGVNPATNRIYVANAGPWPDPGDDSVSVIDGAQSEVIATINVGDEPMGVGANPATNRIYVANLGSDFVSVIDGTRNKVIANIPVGDGPNGIGVNAITNRIYVANSYGDSISVIDGARDIVIATIPVKDAPIRVGINPVANRVYVCHGLDDLVSVIGGARNNVIATFPVGYAPVGVGANPATNRVYVANGRSQNVSVLVESDLLPNPSFDGDENGDGLPDTWRTRNLGAGDSLDDDPHADAFDGKFSMRLTGAPGVTKVLTQGIAGGGAAGTRLNLEAVSKADSTAPGQGEYMVKVQVVFTDQTSGAFALNFGNSPKETFGWRRRVRSFTVPKDYDRLVVKVIYANPTGTVWFDALHLWPSN